MYAKCRCRQREQEQTDLGGEGSDAGVPLFQISFFVPPEVSLPAKSPPCRTRKDLFTSGRPVYSIFTISNFRGRPLGGRKQIPASCADAAKILVPLAAACLRGDIRIPQNMLLSVMGSQLSGLSFCHAISLLSGCRPHCRLYLSGSHLYTHTPYNNLRNRPLSLRKRYSSIALQLRYTQTPHTPYARRS